MRRANHIYLLLNIVVFKASIDMLMLLHLSSFPVINQKIKNSGN